MNFHWGQGSQWGGEILSGHREGLLHRLTCNQFGGHAGNGNRRFASKSLESGLIDDLLAIFLGELDPHPEHVAAIGASDGPDGIRAFHFPKVFRVFNGVLDALFEIGWIGWIRFAHIGLRELNNADLHEALGLEAVAWNAGIHFLAPSVDSTSQALHIGKTVSDEIGGGIHAAAALVIEEDDKSCTIPFHQ